MSLPEGDAADDPTGPAGQDTANCRAATLNDLAVRQAEVARRADALATATKAVTGYQWLAEANPAAFLPRLITSVTTMAGEVGGPRTDATTGSTQRGRANNRWTSSGLLQ